MPHLRAFLFPALLLFALALPPLAGLQTPENGGGGPPGTPPEAGGGYEPPGGDPGDGGPPGDPDEIGDEDVPAPDDPPVPDPGGNGGDGGEELDIDLVGDTVVCVGCGIWLHVTGAPDGSTFAWSIDAGAAHIDLFANDGTAQVGGKARSFVVGDVVITVTVTAPDGDTDSATWEGTVVDVDMVLYRAPVLGVGQTELSEHEENSKGAQTWENLDNDDHDESYDLSDSPVAWGDDELGMIELRLYPKGVTGGTAHLLVHDGESYVRFWKDPYKNAAFDYASTAIPFSEFQPSGGGASSFLLWLEGIAPCKEPGEVVLEYRTSLSCGNSCSDVAFYTILGAKEIRFLGRENGFTEDGRNVSDTLDVVRTKTVDGETLEYRRVFPGGRAPDTKVPRDWVDVEVEITPKPVEKVDLYLRTMDQDDPSDEHVAVDPNDCAGAPGTYGGGGATFDPHDDNRGTQGGGKRGTLKAASGTGEVVKLTFQAHDTIEEAELQVAHQPGDSYRLVCNADVDFLQGLENLDAFDQVHVVDPDVAMRAPILKWKQYTSCVLEVWRILHLEWDSMRFPLKEQNGAKGGIVRLDKKARTVEIASSPLSLNGQAAASLDDGSPDATTGEPGRFEKGKLEITGTKKVFGIASNGDLTFQLSDEPVLTYEVVDKHGGKKESGYIKRMFPDAGGTGARFDVHVAGTPLDFQGYVGGKMTIEGAIVLDVEDNSSLWIETKQAQLPFFAVDDDDNSVLPDFENALILVDSRRRPTLSKWYEPAYVDVVQDGGGMGQHVQHITIPLDINLPSGNGSVSAYDIHHESEKNADDVFWIAYVLSAFQAETKEDNDSKIEKGTPLGHASSEVALAYRETIRDAENSIKAMQLLEIRTLEVAAHEIGHLFGLGHYDAPLWPDNLMTAGPPNTVLLPDQLDHIRCRIDDPRHY